MARIRLECECSWVFFVSHENAGQRIKCPSCQNPLLVPVPAGMRARRPAGSGGGKSFLMLGGVGAGVAIVAIAGYLLLGGKSDPPPRPPDKGTDTSYEEDAVPKKEDATAKKEDVAPKVEPKPEDQVDYHKKIDEMVYLMNASGIICELLRHRGDKKKRAELQGRMAVFLREYEACFDHVGRKGEKHFKAEFMRAGDTIMFLEGQELRDDAPDYAIKLLSAYLGQDLRANTFCEVTVLRDGVRHNILMYFAWLPKEVIDLVNFAGIIPSGKGQPTATKKPEKAKLPETTLAEVRLRLKNAHPYYLAFLSPEERERMDELLKTGTGYLEDDEFLRKRILTEFAQEVDAEIRSFATLCADLEAGALQVAKADVIHLKEGGRKEGTIIEETTDYVRLEIKVGNNKASLKYDKSDIAKIERGQGSGAQVPERLKKAGSDVALLADLFKFCKDNNLKAQADYVAYKIVSVDPDHALSRQHLGYQKDSGGRWRREDAVEAEGGKFKYQGQWVTMEELEKRLTAAGYVKLSNGLFYTKKNWSFTIDNLYKDLSKADIFYENAGMLDMIEGKSDVVYDIAKKEWVKKDKKVILGRFFGALGSDPTVIGGQTRYSRREGRVRITVTAPGPIFRCRVKAPGQVIADGAMMVVRVFGGVNSTGETVYKIQGKGANEKTFDVSPAVVGFEVVAIEAQLVSPWSPETSGDAMFLPCARDDRDVFKISCEILQPADTINKMIGKATTSTPTKTPSHEPTRPNRDVEDQKAYAKIKEYAAEVLKSKPGFGKMVVEMQNRTSALRYYGILQVPAEYGSVTAHIIDPLSFKPEQMNVQASMEVDSWWQKLKDNEKKAFTEFIGVWCASRRAEK